jgi:hypothetical protein
VIDGDENRLEGWTVSATNGVKTYTTTSDADGRYVLNVPRGTWTITEELQGGWSHTFPSPEAVHVVTVPIEGEGALGPVSSFFAMFVTTAHAATIGGPNGDYNFGNKENRRGGGSSGTRVNRGGSSSSSGGEVRGASDTAPEVQGAVAPVGAPNTGAGGASGSTFFVLSAFLGILAGISGIFGFRRSV